MIILNDSYIFLSTGIGPAVYTLPVKIFESLSNIDRSFDIKSIFYLGLAFHFDNDLLCVLSTKRPLKSEHCLTSFAFSSTILDLNPYQWTLPQYLFDLTASEQRSKIQGFVPFRCIYAL